MTPGFLPAFMARRDTCAAFPHAAEFPHQQYLKMLTEALPPLHSPARLLSRNCSDSRALLSSSPLLMLTGTCVPVLHPGASGVGLSTSKLQPPTRPVARAFLSYSTKGKTDRNNEACTFHTQYRTLFYLHSPWKIENDEDIPVRQCSYCCAKEGWRALKVIVWGRNGVEHLGNKQTSFLISGF